VTESVIRRRAASTMFAGVIAGALAPPACGGESTPDAREAERCPIGDMSAAPEVEIMHLDAQSAVVQTQAMAQVPLIPPPQGGWIVLLGARATNVDGCRVDLTTSFRDGPGAAVLKVDRRPTLLDDTGDGWGTTRPTEAGNLPICPQATAARDLHDEAYEVTVALEDAYGQQASRSIVIVPTCPAQDPTGRCRCECARGYVVGGPCPP